MARIESATPRLMLAVITAMMADDRLQDNQDHDVFLSFIQEILNMTNHKHVDAFLEDNEDGGIFDTPTSAALAELRADLYNPSDAELGY